MTFISGKSRRVFRQHDLTHSPVGLWQFNSSLADTSGNGFTLTLNGTNAYTTLNGAPAFAFNGSTYLTRASNDAALTITGDLTIEMLASFHNYPGVDQTNTIIVNFGETGDGDPTRNVIYQFRTRTAAPGVQYNAETGDGTTDILYEFINGTPPDDTGHHLAFRRQSNVLSLFVDGILLNQSGTITAATGGSASRLSVGAFVDGALPVRMTMGSLKIIASALSDAQVLAEAQRTVL